MRSIHVLLIASLASLVSPVAESEIVFVDPVQEKAQETRQDEPKTEGHDELRDRLLDTARDYRDHGQPMPPPLVILRSGPPPSDAALVREAARIWVDRDSAATTSNRCRTENTVGGIEGSPRGRTVIQGNVDGKNTICK